MRNGPRIGEDPDDCHPWDRYTHPRQRRALEARTSGAGARMSCERRPKYWLTRPHAAESRIEMQTAKYWTGAPDEALLGGPGF